MLTIHMLQHFCYFTTIPILILHVRTLSIFIINTFTHSLQVCKTTIFTTTMATRTTAGLGYISPTRTVTTDHDSTNCILSKADTGPPESHRYFLARRTVLEMLRDRGCVVEESEINRSVSEFRSLFGDQPVVDNLSICVPLSSSRSKKVIIGVLGFVFFWW